MLEARVFRIERDGLSILGQSLVLPAFGLQNAGEDGTECSHSGVRANGRLKPINGFIVPAQVCQDEGEDLMARDLSRVEIHGLTPGLDGLRSEADHRQRRTEPK